MDDLHCYTCRENSVRKAEEHNSLVKNLKKKIKKKKNRNGSLKKRFNPNPHHKTQENQTQRGYSHRKKPQNLKVLKTQLN